MTHTTTEERFYKRFEEGVGDIDTAEDESGAVLRFIEEEKRVVREDCCEKCWEPGAKEKDLRGHYFCLDYACPCHKQDNNN